MTRNASWKREARNLMALNPGMRLPEAMRRTKHLKVDDLVRVKGETRKGIIINIDANGILDIKYRTHIARGVEPGSVDYIGPL